MFEEGKSYRLILPKLTAILKGKAIKMNFLKKEEEEEEQEKSTPRQGQSS